MDENFCNGITSLPSARLRPFASKLWWSASPGQAAGARECVLPTGHMHLVFRLDGPPLRVYADHNDMHGSVIGEPVIGGAHTRYYVKDVGAPVVSVGVVLLPGAAQTLFGAGAAEFSDTHTGLSGVWGADARLVFERIAEAGTAHDQLRMLDAQLVGRLAPLRGMHPQIAQAVAALSQPGRIDALARASGVSHRSFIANFRHAAGMSPKRYACIARFGQVLKGLRASPAVPLTDLALAAGYSDQAHMTREFRLFASLTPGQYRLLAPAAAHHVPVAGAPRQRQFYSRLGTASDL